jgi:2'-hydroxyisoflavone reductase
MRILDRRKFLLGSLAAGSSAALGCAGAPPPDVADSPPPPPPAKPETAPTSAPAAAGPPKKTLLILGGTRLIGPHVVEAAKARGYTVTLFNRGRTRPELFPDLEKLHGDRDPTKGEGLKALQGRKWDAVIDNSGYVPRIVRASAELLAPNVGQYIFVSSISAYADNSVVGADESAPVATMADPTVEEMGKEYENYGPLKALCEQAAEKAMPGRVANVRPGYIVGPEDGTDRFTYWPVRVARGGEMLVPGTPDDPIQIIDVRDLADFLMTLVDNRTMGVFNAVGPGEPLTMGGVLDICKAATGANPTFTWVSGQFLKERPEPVELPIWEIPEGKSKGFHTWSSARARKAGLKYRPVAETVKDTLTWFRSLPEERQQKIRAGLPPEKEAALLAEWKKLEKEKGKKPDPKKKKAG